MDFSFHASQPSKALGANNLSATPAAFSRSVVGGPGFFTKVLGGIATVSVLATLGLFGWQYYLEKTITQKKQALAAYGNTVSDLPLQDIKALSSKLKMVNTLVKEYPYVTNVFPIIEESIENRVTYNSLDLQLFQGGYVLNIDAEAPDYKTIARQLDVLRSDVYKRYFPKLTLDTLSPGDKGRVGFSITTPVNIEGVTPDELILNTTLSEENLSTLLSGTTSLDVASSSEFQVIESARIP